MTEEPKLEYTKEDCRIYGLAFETEMLKTDPEDPEQIRKGEALLKVVERVLMTILDDLEEDEEDASEE